VPWPSRGAFRFVSCSVGPFHWSAELQGYSFPIGAIFLPALRSCARLGHYWSWRR